MLVASGPDNRHAYWLYDEALDDVERAARLAQGWVGHASHVATELLGREIKLDSVGELARMLRLAGTIRWKGEDLWRVELLDADGPRYTADAIEQAIPARGPDRQRTHGDAALSPVTVDLDDPRLRAYVQKAVKEARTWPLAGIPVSVDKTGGRPGRIAGSGTNNQLNTSAGVRPRDAVWGAWGRCSPRAYSRALVEEASAVNRYLEEQPDGGREICESTLRSGWDPGLSEPRTLPGWMTGEVADDDDGWGEVDLADAVTGEKARAAPTLLARVDGACLLYPGQINELHGADGTGKSFVALFAAEAGAGRRAPRGLARLGGPRRGHGREPAARPRRGRRRHPWPGSTTGTPRSRRRLPGSPGSAPGPRRSGPRPWCSTRSARPSASTA